ncbi:zinc finger CCCH domain-containing protein 1-like [Zingiber officinale]|uniref:zinc finger CCCH domain-containing protein 1-like n=1 Tax=Zingiber officinale TaxID=94328 RepID=UPI001C4DD0E5|nr:zinc finger CCCH domain-containing protein 1-like [Zingiber officinale]
MASMTSDFCIFFRKPKAAKNIRKRKKVDSDEEVSGDDIPYSSPATKKSAGLSFSSSSSGVGSLFQFDSSKEIQVKHDSRATATLETETEFSKYARAIRERVLKRAEEALKGKSKPCGGGNDKIYKGIHGYTDYKAGFRREQTVAGEKASGAHGPLRASAHIRLSARFDYQPDICKDYKETGYCGYGDSCKFMHDRGDYKSGWQLEKDWEEAEKARKKRLAARSRGDNDEADHEDGNDDDDEADDSLPFACFICRQPFEDPVVTKCKHYFCEHCALKHHAKNKKCFVCNKPTLGIFNTAHEIREKMAEGK